MFEEKYVQNVLRHILRAFLDEVRKELERFADALSLWVNELLARRLPPDWRAQMHAFFDA